MNGPANAIIRRCQRGFARNTAGIGCDSSPGCSPAIFTYPPNRIARKPEVRLAFLKPTARAEAEAERLDPDIEETGRPVVAQLMDQDHDPEQNQQPPDVLNDMHTNYLRSH